MTYFVIAYMIFGLLYYEWAIKKYRSGRNHRMMISMMERAKERLK